MRVLPDPTPVYTAALREAKRRTRKVSREREYLDEMDVRTTPRTPEAHFRFSLHSLAPAIPGLDYDPQRSTQKDEDR